MASRCKINFYEKPVINIPGLSFKHVDLIIATDKIKIHRFCLSADYLKLPYFKES
jgi:hypothetical protein